MGPSGKPGGPFFARPAAGRLRRLGRRVLPVALALAAAACGDADGPPVTADDRASGAEQHPALLAQLGGAYAGDEAAYVRRLGARIAAAAGLEGQCTFTLTDSAAVNAFAAPGCYIYVTRGLAAIVNSEAELAAVLGHEVGHIVARHGREQERRSLLRSLGVLAVALVTGSEGLTVAADVASGLFTLRYSRQHEFEADKLGIAYLSRAKLDPFAGAEMLDTLGRYEAAQKRGVGPLAARVPEWARTHPLSARRAEQARAEAQASGLRPDVLPDRSEPFLEEIDGMRYGESGKGPPLVVSVVRVGPGNDAAALAAQMATDDQLAHFRMLNALEEDEEPRAGQQVKLIRIGRGD